MKVYTVEYYELGSRRWTLLAARTLYAARELAQQAADECKLQHPTNVYRVAEIDVISEPHVNNPYTGEPHKGTPSPSGLTCTRRDSRCWCSSQPSEDAEA